MANKTNWGQYRKDVRSTEAYTLFVAQGAALRSGDMELFRKITDRQRKKRENQEWELVKPMR